MSEFEVQRVSLADTCPIDIQGAGAGIFGAGSWEPK